MPSRSRSVQAHIDGYVQWLTERNYPVATIKNYRGVVGRGLTALEEAGLRINPKTIGDVEIFYLLNVTLKDHAEGWRWRQMSTFGNWLIRIAGNNIYKMLGIRFGSSEDTEGAGWIDPYNATQVLKFCHTLEETFVIHTMLHLGYRKAEVEDALMTDFDRTARKVRIRGKGGKVRIISFHPLTEGILKLCLQQREKMINTARVWYLVKNRLMSVPEHMLMYFQPSAGGLGNHKHTSIEKIIKRVSDRMKVYFSAHTLRKTSARMQHLAGVRIERISKFLGHSDVRVTMKYLGVNVEDMDEAQQQTWAFSQRIAEGGQGL